MVPQEADEEEDNYDEVSSQTHSGMMDVAQPVREQSLLWEDGKKEKTKKEKKKGKSALSNLFHFGRQRGKSGNGNGNGNGTEGVVKEKEHHWRAAEWHSEEHAREREAREREEEMRRIEWEKRQEEIMQGAAVSPRRPLLTFCLLFSSQNGDIAPSPKSQPIHMPNV